MLLAHSLVEDINHPRYLSDLILWRRRTWSLTSTLCLISCSVRAVTLRISVKISQYKYNGYEICCGRSNINMWFNSVSKILNNSEVLMPSPQRWLWCWECNGCRFPPGQHSQPGSQVGSFSYQDLFQVLKSLSLSRYWLIIFQIFGNFLNHFPFADINQFFPDLCWISEFVFTFLGVY